ncbi:MAG: radical SAM protein [Deltaproteobacteria bacterium]|nr:radical SAM protein [Deltaproteobacteria bacterium]
MARRVLFIVKEIEGAEPLGALYIAGCLRAAGHDVRFIGTRGVDVLAQVAAYAPDVVAFGSTTGLHRYYLGLAYAIKQRFPSVLTLFGGPHPTFYPDVIFSPGIDVICQGEGEDAAVELCDALDRGDDHRAIRDLWVKHEGAVYKNPPRALRRDLDAIPNPPRELLYEFDDLLRRRPLKSFTTNRGCPFPCSYCFNPSLVDHYGSSWKKVRIRSPERVVDEVTTVQRQGPLDVVGFRESIFVYSKQWLREFGERYRSEVRLPYYCHLRADMLDEEMVELLAWSGCHTVNVGIETASERIANEVLDRHIKMDRLKRGVRLLKKAGIVVFADNILGIPGGTLEDDLATLALNVELDVDYAAATLCTPYPGTKLAEYAVANGYFSGDFESIHESYYTESVLRFRSEREKRQIENLHKVFAVAAALPALLPVWKRLLHLPPNDFFYAMFRSWYLVAHFTDVMPRRMDLEHAIEGLRSIFGVFYGSDENVFATPADEPALVIDQRPGAGACDASVPKLVAPSRLVRQEVADVR